MLSLIPALPDLLRFALAAGIAGILLMGFDKSLAADESGGRISERTLWLIALVGGFWGIILGGFLFHHKTSKGAFWPPVALATILWLVLLFSIILGYFKP